MRKTFIAILIVFMLVSAGCTPETYSFKVFDKITNAPFNGNAVVNGKSVIVKNGVLIAHSPKIEIEAEGYERTTSDSSTVFLKPKAYLVIKCRALPSKISTNGKVKRFYILQNGEYVVSPMPLGTVSLSVETRFFNKYETKVNIKNGENEIVARLTLNENALKNFLRSASANSGTFTISENGKLDEDNINYTFEISVKNGNVLQIKYKGISYEFKNGIPFIETDSGKKEVTNNEDVATLLYVKKTAENLFPLSELTKGLSFESASKNMIIMSGERTFENRKFYETLSINAGEESIKKIDLRIQSPEIENADLSVTIERIGN